VRWMSAPSAIAETHVSNVLLIGDRAYKLKKPVRTGFLDFTTPEARRRACEREVELNRRFSPDVYLGVATVLDTTGQPCDSVVVMRRMPAERRLATLVRAGADVHDDIRRIARLVATFHARALTSQEVSAAASMDSVSANWEANFEQMKGFYGSVLDLSAAERVELLVRRFLRGRGHLFQARIAAGMARDGHGDLKTEDIFCLDDGPRILDCIEFDDRLRYGDVLADTAFLAMDLERIGARASAKEFMELYAEFSSESHPDSLVHHYIAYRAHVRAKVACIRHEQGLRAAAADAGQLLAISLDHLERARVRMVLVGGLPGSGKSTVATGLADTLGWALFRSDEVRKDLAGLAHDAPAPAALGAGLYRPELVAATYHEMLRRAQLALENGVSVVLDATWREEHMREAAQHVAEETFADLAEVRCVAPPALLVRRLAARKPGTAHGSDVTAGVLEGMGFDAWPGAAEVDTSGRSARSVASAVQVAAPERVLGKADRRPV
jgi:aminoglycoside phosphotransferase family enzyme/predicted kinase